MQDRIHQIPTLPYERKNLLRQVLDLQLIQLSDRNSTTTPFMISTLRAFQTRPREERLCDP